MTIPMSQEIDMDKTRISVVITCYNYGQFLTEAVESVFKQTGPSKEIIIIDDCSTDNTPQIVQHRMWELMPEVLYFRNERNMGTVKSIDIGIKASIGDYVMHLDADNRLRPTYLNETSKVLDERPKVGVVYTDSAVFGPMARELSQNSTWWRNRREEDDFLIWEYFDFNRDRLRQRNYIHGSALFRRKCYDQAKGYAANEIPGKPEDYTFWKKILLDLNWDAYYIKKPLLEYRQHSRHQRNIQQCSAR